MARIVPPTLYSSQPHRTYALILLLPRCPRFPPPASQAEARSIPMAGGKGTQAAGYNIITGASAYTNNAFGRWRWNITQQPFGGPAHT